MQRYFVRCAYHGAKYCGWQIQNNASSVQGTIQEKLSLVFRSPIEIIGCGRTDSGVHASSYFFHFDSPQTIDSKLEYSIVSIMPSDISIFEIIPVNAAAHTRYDAITRQYVYQLRLVDSPFGRGEYFDYKGKALDQELLVEASQRLLSIEDFEIFSKKGSQVNHFLCDIMESRWDFDDPSIYYYHIKANRFLRGMVRLLVGMQINVATGRISMDTLDKAIADHQVLSLNYSAPAEGLYLCEIKYPDSVFQV